MNEAQQRDAEEGWKRSKHNQQKHIEIKSRSFRFYSYTKHKKRKLSSSYCIPSLTSSDIYRRKTSSLPLKPSPVLSPRPAWSKTAPAPHQRQHQQQQRQQQQSGTTTRTTLFKDSDMGARRRSTQHNFAVSKGKKAKEKGTFLVFTFIIQTLKKGLGFRV